MKLIFALVFSVFCGSAEAATFGRVDGGYLIDVAEADSIAAIEKRLGVKGFVQVPDGTVTNSAVTLDAQGKIMSITAPKPPPEPSPPKPLPPPTISAATSTVVQALIQALVDAGIATADEKAALATAIKGIPPQ